MEQKDIFNDDEDRSLLAAFGWWEKRRLAYNIVIGACGVLVLIFIVNAPLDPSLVIDVVLYGVIVNLFYTLGFLIEVVSRYYFKSDRDFRRSRNGLFWTGLAISVLVTTGIGLMLGSMQHPG